MFDTHLQTHKVLIVDDEAVPRSLESFALEGTGRYVAMQAGNATDALTMLAGDKYDVAVIDVDMPDMSGLELIRHIRERTGHDRLPIVLVLPEDSDMAAEDFDMTNATRAIGKPFDPWMLARMLDSLTAPVQGMEQVLSVEAVLHGFPYPTMILDAQHHVLLANGPFYESTGTGVGECYIHCAHEMHDDELVPSACPLEECIRSNKPAERDITTKFGSLRTSVYPLAIKSADGNPLYLHVTQPIECCD